MAIRIWDLIIMKPPEFHGSKMDVDPQEFIDEAYKIMAIMGVSQIRMLSLCPINLRASPKCGMTNRLRKGATVWGLFHGKNSTVPS